MRVFLSLAAMAGTPSRLPLAAGSALCPSLPPAKGGAVPSVSGEAWKRRFNRTGTLTAKAVQGPGTDSLPCIIHVLQQCPRAHE